MSENITSPIVASYVGYTDFNIWLVMLLATLALLVVSHAVPRAGIVYALLSNVFAVAALWGSLGLVSFEMIMAPQVVENTMWVYAAPLVKQIAAPWVTGVMVALLGICILNTLYVYAEDETGKGKFYGPRIK